MLSAGHSSYTAAGSDIETQQLFLMDPRNVSKPPSFFDGLPSLIMPPCPLLARFAVRAVVPRRVADPCR